MNVEKSPSKKGVHAFDSSIWGTEGDYNVEAKWLAREEEQCEGLEEQKWDEIKAKEVLKNTQNWKSPEIDKSPDF